MPVSNDFLLHVTTFVQRMVILIGSLVCVFLCVFFASQTSLARDRNYIVAAAEARHDVNLKRLSCLTVVENGAFIYAKNHFNDPRIDGILRNTLPGTIIQRNASDCSHALSFNIITNVTRAVKYRGHPSVLLMSFDVCETDAGGRINNKVCTNKNLYLFEKDLAPFEAFEIGVRAFFKDQDQEWAIMTIAVQSKDR